MESRHMQSISQGLILVAVMLALIAAALWFRPGPIEPAAQAQVRGAVAQGEGVPDSGRQRQMMIEQLDTLNKRLAEIERGLRDGSFTVQVVDQRGAGKTGAKDGAREGGR